MKSIKKQLRTHIQSHDTLKAQADLLTSVVGIGPDTAARLLAEIGDIRIFDSARQLAAFAGLTPQEHTSVTSVQGKPYLCKLGNARLRKAHYFPALVMLQRVPEIQPFRNRLAADGKTKMAIVGAVMHKLICIVYGVLSSGQAYDPPKLLPQKSTPKPA
jgi:transposase